VVWWNTADMDADGATYGATAIELVPLADTGLEVSRMILGCSSIGGLFSECDPQTAADGLAAAWEVGIRTFDTAPHYGVGLSEERLGAFLAGKQRSEFVVSTKVGRRLVLAHPDVDAVVIGARWAEKVHQNAGYLHEAVPRELFDELAAEGLVAPIA
jgi:aryl-alcohol dehydrogenase-like predicted oxidoreductase